MPITASRPRTGTRATHAQSDAPAPGPHHGALDGARAEGAGHRAKPRRVTWAPEVRTAAEACTA
eukprot:3442717-Pleurochrysis_carterae.AAC.1